MNSAGVAADCVRAGRPVVFARRLIQPAKRWVQELPRPERGTGAVRARRQGARVGDSAAGRAVSGAVVPAFRTLQPAEGSGTGPAVSAVR